MKCKIALISWPVKNTSPKDGYINLGEIYDKNIKNNKSILQKMNKELSYMYPFRCKIRPKITCSNIEDFRYFQREYRLTSKLKIEGKFTKNNITFRSPILYDITCMVPVFRKQTRFKYIQTTQKRHVCILPTCKNPIIRGKLVERCMELHSDIFFILSGPKMGKNKDTCSTLYSRYLLSCSVQKKNIMKNIEGDIIDGLDLVELIGIDDSAITIVCTSDDIYNLSVSVREWKQEKKFTLPITYLVIHNSF